MDLTLARPDVGDVDTAGVPVRATAARAAGAFAVVMPAAVRRALQAHADTRHDVEVGGVLIGAVRLDADAAAGGRPYLFVEAGIPALAAESRGTNITFTADAWALIHETIDRDHPDARIVGWYHTHPAFGIFLSEMDLFIQRHFFDLPHQVAIVIDPVARTDGCFVWRDGEPTVAPIAIEPDGSDDAAVVLAPVRHRDVRQRPPRIVRPQRVALVMLLAVASALVATLVAIALSSEPAAGAR